MYMYKEITIIQEYMYSTGHTCIIIIKHTVSITTSNQIRPATEDHTLARPLTNTNYTEQDSQETALVLNIVI